MKYEKLEEFVLFFNKRLDINPLFQNVVNTNMLLSLSL